MKGSKKEELTGDEIGKLLYRDCNASEDDKYSDDRSICKGTPKESLCSVGRSRGTLHHI